MKKSIQVGPTSVGIMIAGEDFRCFCSNSRYVRDVREHRLAVLTEAFSAVFWQ
jgi:hypothetical protein